MCISKQRQVLTAQSIDMSALQKPSQHRPKRSSKSGKRRDQYIVVQHHYHDHAEEKATTEEKLILDSAQQNPLVASFPMKLYMMLEQVEVDGNSHIVSWQPHGRCFVVHEPELFKELLPRYFSLSKVSSFQRQLNLYDFTRLTRGKDKGGYYNEFFLRGKAHLLNKIQRIKVKGTGVRARSNPEQEPDFWTMEWVSDSAAAAASNETNDMCTPSNMMSSHASVVSHDEQDMDVPAMTSISYQDENDHVPSSSLADETFSDDEIDMKLCGWGMPFYYLESLPGQQPQGKSSSDLCPSTSIGDNMNFLYSNDMDDFLDSVVGVNTDMSFNDMLEKIVD